MHAFSDYICDWLGIVNDCYILHSRSLEEAFQLFQSISPLETLHDSDEELPTLAQKRSEIHPSLLYQNCSGPQTGNSSEDSETF